MAQPAMTEFNRSIANHPITNALPTIFPLREIEREAFE
jgi:hypothetical protein